MYSYNTNEGGTGAFIRDLAIKLIFVVILVLLLIWLFPKPDMKPFYDRFFTENITLMKDTAKAYYTNERLPKEVDDKVTMTLGEMINKHLILNLIDKEGNTCDTEKSYVEVTKLKTEYAMKVYLSCSGEYDYIIEYIGCLTVCENCGQTPLVAEPVKTVAKPGTVSKPTPKPTTQTPQTPQTPQTVTYNTYGKPTVVTYSDWKTTDEATTTTTSNGITTTYAKHETRTINGTLAYYKKQATVYSAGYIIASNKSGYFYDYKGTRILDLSNLGMSNAAQDLSPAQLGLKVTGWAKLETISDFQNYLANKATTFKTAEINAYNSDVHTPNGPTAQMLKDSTVSAMKIISTNGTSQNSDGLPELVWNNQYRTYQVFTRAWIYNTANIKPYYDAKLNMNIMFVAHKFFVEWNEPTTTSQLEYKYVTTISYEDRRVLAGSVEEKTLIANGYTFKKTETVNL